MINMIQYDKWYNVCEYNVYYNINVLFSDIIIIYNILIQCNVCTMCVCVCAMWNMTCNVSSINTKWEKM